ncbi:hypothetical protein U5A82_20110 [Sphingobium sp. CR2-8]|uniref:hypothetical protein n=1 Tax=Sphingobium sp. CR2-8 TaxID=1306534 RepID=UPI002DB6FB6A|nr:hypothetical protein [Sphingobium sp. CR2-8]MEC3912692.1 hypothetical protein [Sphingobium sp. CR2-8]
MAIVGWILSFVGLFAGLALRQDLPIGGSVTLSNMLLVFALLACPMIWRDKPLGVSRGQRIVIALVMILTVPLVLLPAA